MTSLCGLFAAACLSIAAAEQASPATEDFEGYPSAAKWHGGGSWTGLSREVTIDADRGRRGNGLLIASPYDDVESWWQKKASPERNIVVSWYRVDGRAGIAQAREYSADGCALGGIDFVGPNIVWLHGDGKGGNVRPLTLVADYKLGRWYRLAREYDFGSNRFRVKVDDAGWSEWGNLFNDRKAASTGRTLVFVRNGSLCVDDLRISGALPPYEAAPDRPLPPPLPLRLVKTPYLQMVTQESVVIMWETSLPATSVVEYGEGTTYGREAAVPGLRKIHEVRLRGLSPWTKYHYRVRSSVPGGPYPPAASEDATCRTAAPAGTPFTFAVYGDSRSDHRPRSRHCHRLVAEAMARRAPAIVLHTGDIVMGSDGYEEYQNEHFGPGRKLFKNTPCFVAIGDHERRYGHASWFHRFFSYPEPETYYSFDYGDAHFTVLDCSIAKDGGPGLGPGSAQREWLVRDLVSAKAKWKFAFLHYPVYTSVRRGSSKARAKEMRSLLTPIFEQHGVDLVFNGHAHFYERTHPIRSNTVDETDGVIYVTTGGGGASLEQPAPSIANNFWTAKALSCYHFCLVAVGPDRLKMSVCDTGGKVLDLLTLE